MGPEAARAWSEYNNNAPINNMKNQLIKSIGNLLASSRQVFVLKRLKRYVHNLFHGYRRDKMTKQTSLVRLIRFQLFFQKKNPWVLDENIEPVFKHSQKKQCQI